MSLSLHRTIGDFDASEWNELAGGNPFATHGWLKTVEGTWRTPVEPLYFALRRDDELIAGAVCYIARYTAEAETLDDLLFGRLAGAARAIGLSFLPAMVCGPALGYGWHVGTSGRIGPVEADQARGALVDAIDTEARGLGLRVSFVQVLDEERELRHLLDERKYLPCRNVPVAVLDLKWRSFGEYLEGLSRRQRREFKRQINRSDEAGNVIGIEEVPAGDEGRLIELLDGTSRKYGDRSFAAGVGFFREIRKNMGAGVRLFTIRKRGRVTGISVVLIQPPGAVALAVGVDREAAARDYGYFQVSYNAPIADAVERGIERLYFGREMYDVKLRRGCRLTNAWIYSNHSGPRGAAVKSWYAAASLWNRWKLPAVVRRALY